MSISTYRDSLTGKWLMVDTNRSAGLGIGKSRLSATQDLFNRVSGMHVYSLEEIKAIYSKQNCFYLTLDEFINTHFIAVENSDGSILGYTHNLISQDEFILGDN